METSEIKNEQSKKAGTESKAYLSGMRQAPASAATSDKNPNRRPRPMPASMQCVSCASLIVRVLVLHCDYSLWQLVPTTRNQQSARKPKNRSPFAPALYLGGLINAPADRNVCVKKRPRVTTASRIRAGVREESSNKRVWGCKWLCPEVIRHRTFS